MAYRLKNSLKRTFDPSLLKNIRFDFPASVVVFLVALPLCLGMALASDAPLFSGVLTGIIGGVVVGLLSGSQLSVSGPANSLTVIVAVGIHKLGGFEALLCAVVLSGVFQIGFGLLRVGFLASLFPNSVINGMLSAIGITIMLKQFPHALGGPGRFESDMSFLELWGQHPTTEVIRQTLSAVNGSTLLIFSLSLVLLILWEKPFVKKNPWLSRVPGPLAAAVFATLINGLFKLGFPDMVLRAQDGHLVSLPNIDSLSALWGELRFPDFRVLGNLNVWTVGLTIAAVGSIESLLSLESTDKLDPFKRVSNTNQELFAQGAGNILAGLVGGIPMTSVIVRSSANIYAGARSRLSTILHGFILLFSVVALHSILNHIPVSALAAVLIVVGFKLAHPKIIRAAYRNGWDQFLPFAITIVAILFTDLLRGVAIGLLVGLGFVVKTSFYSAILVVRDGKSILIRFTKDVTFIHKIKLRKELAAIPEGSQVFFDASRAMFIDRDVFEMLEEFASSAPNRGISVEMKDIYLGQPKRMRPSKEESRHASVQEAAPSKSRLGG